MSALTRAHVKPAVFLSENAQAVPSARVYLAR